MNLGGGCKKYIACHGTLDPPMETIQYHSQREEGGMVGIQFHNIFPSLFCQEKIMFVDFFSPLVYCRFSLPLTSEIVMGRGLCKYRQTFEPIR